MSTPLADSSASKIRFCSLVSEESGEDPIGSAWSAERYLITEIPLPWGYELLSGKQVPEGLKDFVYGLYAKGIYWGFTAMAPDPAWSVDGHTRILEFVRQTEEITGYTAREFLIPTDRLIPTLEKYVEDNVAPEVTQYQQERPEGLRDFFVCTHGAIDACCAKFGFPIYRQLNTLAKDAATPTRVWRCSHFGGHRFAATLLEMPTGRYYGHLKAPHLNGLITHDLEPQDLRRAYRGWAAMPHTLLQVAEGEAYVRGGWEWTRCAVTHTPAPEAYDEKEGTFTFDYVHPKGERGSITIQVTPTITIQTLGSSNSEEVYDAQQYRCDVLAVSPKGGLLDREPATV